MITGVVYGDEGRIRLKVRGPHGSEQEVVAVIDTGYTASLSLPPPLIAALGLQWRSVDRGTLADGSERLFNFYEAIVVWDGKPRHVLVSEAGTDPLVGMHLLRNHELKMQIRNRGKVTITPLAKKRPR